MGWPPRRASQPARSSRSRGIDAANAASCLDAGAAGIAVMGEVMRAADPEAHGPRNSSKR